MLVKLNNQIYITNAYQANVQDFQRDLKKIRYPFRIIRNSDGSISLMPKTRGKTVPAFEMYHNSIRFSGIAGDPIKYGDSVDKGVCYGQNPFYLQTLGDLLSQMCMYAMLNDVYLSGRICVRDTKTDKLIMRYNITDHFVVKKVSDYGHTVLSYLAAAATLANDNSVA